MVAKLTNQKEKPNQLTILKYIYFLSHYLRLAIQLFYISWVNRSRNMHEH